MNIFNSLGSNYNLPYAFKSLLPAKKNAAEKLTAVLEDIYSGQATLTYKGRQALELALKRSGIKEGSSIAVTGFTCIAVIEAIQKRNLKPVYLDIDPETLNFTAESLRKKLKAKHNIKAVIIQNTLGYPCDMKEIRSICTQNNLILIEDLAHSIGTVYSDGSEAGTAGDFTALSFSQDKSIDAVSGGALIIRNAKYQAGNEYLQGSTGLFSKDRLYPLLTWVIRNTYPFWLGKILHVLLKNLHMLSDPMKSIEGKTMSYWSSMLALTEFKTLKKTLSHRRKIAKVYAENIKSEFISARIADRVGEATNLRFPIFSDNREMLIKYLKKNGVYVSDVWYDAPIAPKKYLGLARYPKELCPEAEKVAGRILNLPTHRNISEVNALAISNLINSWQK